MDIEMINLIGAKRSHYTRKVRILLDYIGIEFSLIDIGDVALANQLTFADNPAMSVPILRDGGDMIYDSEHICSYLVRKYDQHDRCGVLSSDIRVLNARALLNAAMSAEVKLILADRTGLDVNEKPFFQKSRLVIQTVLDWCETNADLFDVAAPNYLSFHFICFWDHMNYYQLVDGVWPKLEAVAVELRKQDHIRKSSINA